MLTLMFDIVLILERVTQILAVRTVLATFGVQFRVPCCIAQEKRPSRVYFTGWF